MWLAYFTWSNVFKIHPCCSMSEFTSFLRLNTYVRCTYILHFVLPIHLSMDTWVVSTLCLLWIMPLWTCVYSIWVPALSSFGIYPGVGSLNNVILFSFIRNCQTVFSSSCCTLHSHQQSTKVPMSTHLPTCNFVFW